MLFIQKIITLKNTFLWKLFDKKLQSIRMDCGNREIYDFLLVLIFFRAVYSICVCVCFCVAVYRKDIVGMGFMTNWRKKKFTKQEKYIPFNIKLNIHFLNRYISNRGTHTHTHTLKDKKHRVIYNVKRVLAKVKKKKKIVPI